MVLVAPSNGLLNNLCVFMAFPAKFYYNRVETKSVQSIMVELPFRSVFITAFLFCSDATCLLSPAISSLLNSAAPVVPNTPNFAYLGSVNVFRYLSMELLTFPKYIGPPTIIISYFDVLAAVELLTPANVTL